MDDFSNWTRIASPRSTMWVERMIKSWEIEKRQKKSHVSSKIIQVIVTISSVRWSAEIRNKKSKYRENREREGMRNALITPYPTNANNNSKEFQMQSPIRLFCLASSRAISFIASQLHRISAFFSLLLFLHSSHTRNAFWYGFMYSCNSSKWETNFGVDFGSPVLTK